MAAEKAFFQILMTRESKYENLKADSSVRLLQCCWCKQQWYWNKSLKIIGLKLRIADAKTELKYLLCKTIIGWTTVFMSSTNWNVTLSGKTFHLWANTNLKDKLRLKFNAFIGMLSVSMSAKLFCPKHWHYDVPN